MIDDDDDTQGYLAAQPKREWVGLTNAELESAYWQFMEIATQNGFETAARKLEAKLKEKNYD